MNAQPRVFLNYRVDDCLAVATTLERELKRVLAHSEIFLDHQSIEPGERWLTRLRDAVGRADVILVLIGPRWLTLQGDDGIRRLDDPEDYLRLEIEIALAGRGTVIPVLVDGTPPLQKKAFRTIPQIATLAELQAFALSMKEWESTFDALVQRLVDLGFRRAARQALSAKRPPGPSRSTIPARGRAPFVGRDDLLDQLRTCLGDETSQEFVVLHGPSGVGKSELAREYARRNLTQYPGGAFYVSVREGGPPVDLATMGRTVLNLPNAADLSLRDQCLQALFTLNGTRFLLIYDNAANPESVESWLPPAGAGGHVLVTSTWDRWDARWQRVQVSPMTDAEATHLVSAITGDDVPNAQAKEMVHFAGGLPVQLVPAAQALRFARARGQSPPPAGRIADEAQASFAAPWNQVSADGRLLLTAALYFHPDRVSRAMLKDALKAVGFHQQWFNAALDRCLDLSLFTGEDPMRLHALLARYIQEHADDVDPNQRRQIRAEFQTRFVQAARTVRTRPTDAAAVMTLTTLSTDTTRWPERATAPRRPEGHAHDVGQALLQIGHFAEARPWFERAVAEKDAGDMLGRVDHESLAASLHGVGGCLSLLKQFEEARPWFVRAVAESEQGDIDGRVDHDSLAISLHQVGFCLSAQGKFAEAGPWFKRAVAEKEMGRTHGRVDHESLGKSLHQVGFCLRSMVQPAEARLWFERAVAEKEQGDLQGRVDHDSLGMSLYSVGFCLLALEQFAEAATWFQRAVAEAERGDVHGRVDHDSVGAGLHQVGSCLWAQGQFAEARQCFERAVAEKERGDMYGRVDEESVELSRARLR